MVLDVDQLLFEYRDYKDPNHKIRSMVQKGELISLKRGLYETDATCPGYVLAYELTGPSYLSFEYALSWYGMIPERVAVYTSAIYGKRKKLSFQNKFGFYTYRDIPVEVFPYYYTREFSKDRPFFIATKEKALCDMLTTISPIRGIHDFEEYLFEGMRLDEDIFMELDFERILRIAPMYHRTNLDQLVRLIRRREQ